MAEIAFTVLALDWSASAFVTASTAAKFYAFLPRLLAFAILIAGIVEKNRRRPSGLATSAAAQPDRPSGCRTPGRTA